MQIKILVKGQMLNIDKKLPAESQNMKLPFINHEFSQT